MEGQDGHEETQLTSFESITPLCVSMWASLLSAICSGGPSVNGKSFLS